MRPDSVAVISSTSEKSPFHPPFGKGVYGGIYICMYFFSVIPECLYLSGAPVGAKPQSSLIAVRSLIGCAVAGSGIHFRQRFIKRFSYFDHRRNLSFAQLLRCTSHHSIFLPSGNRGKVRMGGYLIRCHSRRFRAGEESPPFCHSCAGRNLFS